MNNSINIFALLSFLFLMSCNGLSNFEDNIPEERVCEATNSLIGQTRSFPAGNIYNITGDVTVVSDCEIEVTNFNYDGRGPNVAFYSGVNGNFRVGFPMSDRLNGTNWEDATFSVYLPEGESFEDFNSFSIWCFQFNVDFSSVDF